MGQRWDHSKEMVSYRLSIVTVALSVNHSAVNCDRMSPTLKSTGGGSLWAKISGCSPRSRSLMFGSAKCEHLTNREIIVEEFQRTCDHNSPTLQTDRQTDDMRSQYRALHYSASRSKNEEDSDTRASYSAVRSERSKGLLGLHAATVIR